MPQPSAGLQANNSQHTASNIPSTQDFDVDEGSILVAHPLSSLTTAVPQPTSATIHPIARVACHHPSHLRGIAAQQIIDGHNATQFFIALKHFLRSHGCNLTPQLFDHFDLYKQIFIQLPVVPEIGKSHCQDVIRATPPIPRNGRSPPQPARLDCALVRVAASEQNSFMVGTVFQGRFNTSSTSRNWHAVHLTLFPHAC